MRVARAAYCPTRRSHHFWKLFMATSLVALISPDKELGDVSGQSGLSILVEEALNSWGGRTTCLVEDSHNNAASGMGDMAS